LSPCFETYAELTAYFNEKGGDSYFSDLIAGKRLGWNVTADFYSKGMNINTFSGELDEETFFIYRYIFWASGNGEDIKIPYPPGEEEDTELWNSSFEAGAEEVEDMMSTIEADYENFPLAESQYTDDLCHTFSYSFPCGAVGYGGTYGYTMWNTCGLMQLKFSKPSWLNLDCIGVRFKKD